MSHLEEENEVLKNTTKDGDHNQEMEASKNDNGEETEKALLPNKIEFDELLVHAGELGLYQVLIFMSTMPFYFYVVFVYFSQLFMTQVSSQHWCWVPELANLSAAERREAAIPKDELAKHGHSQCFQYIHNWSISQDTNHTRPIESCRHGWEFSSEIPYPTISSELGWVCDKSKYQSTAQSVFFAGSVCGLLAIGLLADRAGRLRAIVVCNLLGCLGGVASVFATNLIEFSAARFFVGMSFDNCAMLVYLLVLEYIAPKYRTMISSTAFAVFYTLFSVLLPWIALACGNWKTLGLVSSLPMAIAVLAPFVLQESPRWLLSKGRVEEVINNVQKISRMNKKTIPPEVIAQFRETVARKPEEHAGSLWELLKRSQLRRVFLLVCAQQALCDVLFDASVRTLTVLKGDLFISFSLLSVMELPGTMIGALLMDRWGRRWLVGNMMMLNAVFCLAMVFVPRGAVAIACAVVARFGNSACYITAHQWTAELLPTPVRATGVSVAHIFAYMVTMSAQYIFYLGIYIEWLPLVACVVFAVLGVGVALALPETMGKLMPQTYEEAETLIKTDKSRIVRNT